MSLPRRLERLLPTGPFARGVTLLASGTVGGQLIALLALPILTRLYTPSEIGVLAVYASLLGIVTIVAGLRYELAIPLPHNDARATDVMVLALVCVCIVAVVTALLVLLFGRSFAVMVRAPELNTYLWLLPVGVALAGTYQTLSYWAIRSKAFAAIARTKVQQGGAMLVVQVGLGVLHFGVAGLLLGHVVGQSAGLISLYRVFQNRKRERDWSAQPLYLIAVARRYRRFPAYTSWSGLLNASGSQLPPIALAIFFTPAAAGLYMVASRVGSQPLALIGRAIAQVFFSSAAVAKRKGVLGGLTLRTFRTLLSVGGLPIVLLAYLAPPLFMLMFGSHWVTAGTYLQWLTPWLITQFVFAPLYSLSAVLERQSYELLLESTLLLVRLIAFGLGVLWHSAELSVALFGILSAVVFLPYGLWICHLAGAKLRRLFLDVVKEALFVGIAVLGIVILSRLVPQSSFGRFDANLFIGFVLGLPLMIFNFQRVAAMQAQIGTAPTGPR